jgi:hypothetical protein
VSVPQGEVGARLREKQNPALARPQAKGARQVQAKEIEEMAGRTEGIGIARRGARSRRSGGNQSGLWSQFHGQARPPRGAGSSVEIAELHVASEYTGAATPEHAGEGHASRAVQETASHLHPGFAARA